MSLADDLATGWKLIESAPFSISALLAVAFGGGFGLSQFLGKRRRDIQDATIRQLDERTNQLTEHNDMLARLLNDAELYKEFVAIQESPSKKVEIPGKVEDWNEEQKLRLKRLYKLQGAGLAKVESTISATTAAASTSALSLWEELKAMERKAGS